MFLICVNAALTGEKCNLYREINVFHAIKFDGPFLMDYDKRRAA
jgi:hypothetical protein